MYRVALTVIVFIGIIFLTQCRREQSYLRKNDNGEESRRGAFIPKYLKATAEFQDFEKLAKRHKFLKNITDDLNGKLALPRNITVALGPLRDTNAFYDNRTRTITLSYEILQEIDSIDFEGGQPEQMEAATCTILSVVYHEVGHALMDILGLHRQANVEDMADRFSTWLMTVSSRSDRAKYFTQYLNSRDVMYNETSLHDPHLLNKQRRYTTLCLVYGSNAKKYRHMVGGDLLPDERAKTCPAEWEGVDRYWKEELKGYLKDNLRISFRRKYRFERETNGNQSNERAGSEAKTREVTPERPEMQ